MSNEAEDARERFRRQLYEKPNKAPGQVPDWIQEEIIERLRELKRQYRPD